jgi:Trk K+ transport system NAD-binding subunit
MWRRKTIDMTGRYVVVGQGRLAVAIARRLDRLRHPVAVVASSAEERDELAERLGDGVEVVVDKSARLEHFELGGAECLLAVADDREHNLRVAIAASSMPLQRPPVLRAFHPTVAHEIEERGEMNGCTQPWRAYSMAHLAAPHFVAAALLDREDELTTLRLGDDYVGACRLTVRPSVAVRPWRRALERRTPTGVFGRTSCQVLAARSDGGDWSLAVGSKLKAGDEVLVGGPLDEVLRLARDGSTVVAQCTAPEAEKRRWEPASSRKLRLRAGGLWSRLKEAWFQASTSAMRIVLGLLAVVTFAVVVFRPSGPAEGFQLWVTTALGNPSEDGDQLQDVANAVGLLSGGIALGLWVSVMSAHLIEGRMIETTFRKARRLRNHVVVVGVGEVALRVAELLTRLDIPFAMVDPSDTPAARRALQHMDRAPILTGDLDTALGHARIDRAIAVIACSSDNLLNVQACLRAKRSGGAHVRTVARIFDDQLAAEGADMLGVDRQISAVEEAAPAFVDAAVDGAVRSLPRCGPFEFAAVVQPAGAALDHADLADWRSAGVRALALWDREAGLRAPKSPDELPEGPGAAVLAGLSDTMRHVVESLDAA